MIGETHASFFRNVAVEYITQVIMGLA